MKNITKYMWESLSEILTIIKRCKIKYSELKQWSESDPNKFDIQKENEKIIIDELNVFSDIKFVDTSTYYSLINNDKDFSKLSASEKSDFDSVNGDIIGLDKDNKPVYFIDIKISDKYLGAISLGSLTKFNKNGYYLLICTTGKFFKVISHKEVVDALKNGKLQLNAPVNSYKGYDVNWEGEKLTSEYFIKGAELRKL